MVFTDIFVVLKRLVLYRRTVRAKGQSSEGKLITTVTLEDHEGL